MRMFISSIMQGKPKNMLNRIFAIAFALIILTWMCYWIYSTTGYLQNSGMIIGFIIMVTAYSLIIVGLLIEAWKPSLDFTFNRDRIWIFMSIILFAVFILNSVYWWVAYGFPDWVPNSGWQATVVEYILGSFVMETSSLSLMFGILFLTRSVPQKSLNYKIMLIGTVALQFMFLLTLTSAIAGGGDVPEQYKDFWEFTIFQPWFWLDSVSEVVITIGAVWLLVKGKADSKL